MVKDRRFDIVIIIGVLIVLTGMNLYSPTTHREGHINSQKVRLINFTGLCIYSSPDFSVLTDGERKIAILKTLNTGTIYKVSGIMFNSTYSKLKPVKISRVSANTLKLKSIRGALWKDKECYLLTPSRIKLGWCINATKGTVLDVEGISYGSLFYPLHFSSRGYVEKPEEDMPFPVEGIVIYNSPNTVIWNGSEEIRLYLPYHIHLKLGNRVKVLGIAKFYSMLTIVVEAPEDIKIIGEAQKVPVDNATIGNIAEGTCMVLNRGRGLSLNCTTLKLYGFSAKIGDLVKFEAIRRRNSLYCLKCMVVASRNTLSNDICTPNPGKFGKIEGRVKWIKLYKNGFRLANITENSCWILLKLPKSLKISLKENQSITAFGTFTTYRDMPAFHVKSREDICSEKCS